MTTNNKISKSEVMKRAWELFKSAIGICKIGGVAYNFNNFSDCLRRAWYLVKDAVRMAIGMAKQIANRPLQAWELAAQGHYDNAPSGTYFGD